MKKFVGLVSLFVLFAVGSAFSQYWTPLGNFPDDNFLLGTSTGGHGIAVDPDGKVWFQPFGATEPIVTGTGDTVNTRALYVFFPDGTPAPFSPIQTVTIGGVTDTLFNSGRGLKEDADGNILASFYDEVFRIDYQTGEGMAKVTPTDEQTLTAVAVDDANNMFSAHVIPPLPIKIFSPAFLFLETVLDESVGFSRDFEAGPEGNTVYWGGYTNHQIFIFSRADEFSPWELTDSMAQGFDSESFRWSPDNSVLWISAGSYNDLPNQYPGVVTNYAPGAYYAWNVETKEVVDSLIWQFNVPASPNERNRGLAFSPDYRYAYVTCFGASDYPLIQRFENPNWTSVDEEGQLVVNGYKLSQNYPNPFNPSTKISFELPSGGFVTLKVYDMLGREVATLVNSELTSGAHTVNFNAANLSSGTYVYQLSSNGNLLTNKMVLLK
ncbi:MAG TPA: T9SS type A sorting domain-containing protein [Ignavibacteriaceae bacterium]|nr:T9SS type A sorting domain-containing protein [Ignavibacteriaceae bacterium]